MTGDRLSVYYEIDRSSIIDRYIKLRQIADEYLGSAIEGIISSDNYYSISDDAIDSLDVEEVHERSALSIYDGRPRLVLLEAAGPRGSLGYMNRRLQTNLKKQRGGQKSEELWGEEGLLGLLEERYSLGSIVCDELVCGDESQATKGNLTSPVVFRLKRKSDKTEKDTHQHQLDIFLDAQKVCLNGIKVYVKKRGINIKLPNGIITVGNIDLFNTYDSQLRDFCQVAQEEIMPCSLQITGMKMKFVQS